MTGVVLVDKAMGPTSHDVVQAVRTLTGVRRAGHTGTLDPFATGLLPICLGRATRLARFLSGAAKAYWAVVRFGFATDTYDSTGRVVGPVAEGVRLEPEALRRVLATFVGKQQQVPPPFAAKKVGGQRMYKLARAGVRIEPEPVTVVVRRITLLDVQDERATLDVEVESGTYIRSLAHDWGQRLGCGAHVEKLRRTQVGGLTVDRAHTLEELESLRAAGRLTEALLEPAEALAQFPAVQLNAQGARRVSHGMGLSAADVVGRIPDVASGEPICLLGADGRFLAVGAMVENILRPRVVLSQEGSDG